MESSDHGPPLSYLSLDSHFCFLGNTNFKKGKQAGVGEMLATPLEAGTGDVNHTHFGMVRVT